MSETALGVVERLLAERIGLDPLSVGRGLIARGVQARMAVLGLRSKAEYDRALLDSADEVQALVEEVVVPESWFFRDDRPFEALAELARSGWRVDPARPPMAVLSLPCAGGEEPYSIAMTLLEAGLEVDRFRVDAVDVSARALARAIAGVYGPNSFRGSGQRLRPKYFRERNGAFTIDPVVRSTVRFHLGNLLDPASFADRPPFDVVFCRNLLIYLDDGAQARAFETFDRLLVDGGLLFLGHADRADDPGGSPFSPTGDKGCFNFRKGKTKEPESATGKARRARSPLTPSPLVGEGRGGGSHRRRPGKATPSNAASRASSPHPGPPPPGARGPGPKEAAGPEPAPAPSPEPVDPHAPALDRASGLADLGRYDEATGLVERVISGGGADARAYFLLGLIRQAAGDRDRAEAHFLKAVYLDAQHDEALLALALLARRKGDVAAEATYRRRAGRVLARKGTP